MGFPDLDRCLFVDVEASPDGRVRAVGALLRGREFLRAKLRPGERTAAAFRELEEFGVGAQYVVGHFILGFDLSILRKHLPGSDLWDLPVIDTLYLAPLAAPEHPYHRLVKGYKRVPSERNDPVGDCELTRVLLGDCWDLLRTRDARMGGLLDVYRSCFDGGVGVFLGEAGGRRLRRPRLLSRWKALG